MKIGIDLGGHTLIAARISSNRANGLPVIDRAISQRTPEDRSVPKVMAAMSEAIVSLCEGYDVTGVGIAVPGMIDADRKHVRKMPNFPRDWEDLDFTGALGTVLGINGMDLPVKIENDANCYAVGEGHAGLAVGIDDYVVFTMGTGIGCGVVIGGKLLTGTHGMAGEAGHIVVDGDEPCNCGGMGHVETLAAADGTGKRARAAGLTGDFCKLWELRRGHGASKILSVTIDAMARAIASTCHLLDPELIILGGGMSQAPGIAEVIHDAALPYLSRPFKGLLNINVSTLGNHAALFGAASL